MLGNYLQQTTSADDIFKCIFSWRLRVNESFRPFSTANIKALRGSLGALSVNKLSHIPKIQPISAVYENQ